MKLWRIAFVMLAAFSLASCSSDDNDQKKPSAKPANRVLRAKV